MAEFLRIKNVTPKVVDIANRVRETLVGVPDTVRQCERSTLWGTKSKLIPIQFYFWDIEGFWRDPVNNQLHVKFIASVKNWRDVSDGERIAYAQKLMKPLGIIGYPLKPTQAVFAGIVAPKPVTWAELQEARQIIERMSEMLSPQLSTEQ